MYYAITSKGLDRVEQGLPEQRSDYFGVLGALADLEEAEPLKPHSKSQISSTMELPKGHAIYFALKSLIKNGLIEVVYEGDERFLDFK